MAESIMELAVKITALDFFTGPLRSMVSQVTAADGKFKQISNTMKMMGKSKGEIDAINASLNKMADQKAFANIASDLQKIGMAKSDIAAMEGKYMRMAQYQRDMTAAQEKMAAGKDLVASGAGDLMTGALGAFGIVELVKKVGEFQSTMTVIQDATGATTKQMNDLSDAVMNASAQVSKFNDFQMAGFAQQLASGGFNKPSQIQSLLLPMAKYAEVQTYERKHSDPTEAVNQAIEMAHTFKHYDAKGLTNFLDTFNKYSLMQPGASTQLQQTLMYLAPTAFRQMHMKESDVMALAALDNTIGLTGSHGGTNSADMILRLIPGMVGGGPTPIKNSKGKITGYKTPAAWAAMQQLGFIDKNGKSQFFDSKGNITNLQGMITTMIKDGKKLNPMQLTKDYKDIFGIQGGRAASILADPSTVKRLEEMNKQLGTTKSMEQINKNLQNGPEGQLNKAASNSMTLMLRVGKQLAVTLTPAIAKVNDLLDSLLKFSQAHPGVNKLIGDFALFLVGSKMVQGVVKILAGNVKMLSGAFDALKTIKEYGSDITKLGGVLKGLKGAFTFAKDGIALFGSTSLTMFKTFGSGAWSVIKTVGSFAGTLLKLGATAAKWAIEMAADWLIAMGPVGWIIAGVTALIAAGIIMWKTNFLGFRDKLTAIWKVVQNDAGKAWKFIQDKAKDFINFLKNLPKEAEQIGKNIINGLINGVKSMVGAVTGTIKSIGSTISGAFKSVLGIHSPSRVFMEHGKFIVQGLAMGIDKNAGMAKKSTADLAKGVSNSFNHKGSVTGAGSGGIVIQPGAIVINGYNASPEELAELIIKNLGKVTRRSMMNAGVTVNIGAF